MNVFKIEQFLMLKRPYYFRKSFVKQFHEQQCIQRFQRVTISLLFVSISSTINHRLGSQGINSNSSNSCKSFLRLFKVSTTIFYDQNDPKYFDHHQ